MSSLNITPAIGCEDVRLALNGIFSGSDNPPNYYFFDQAISSGSVMDHINLANIWLWATVGQQIMQATDTVTMAQIYAASVDYSCMRLLVVMSGDIIVDGFDIQAGVQVKQPHLYNAYRNLIEQFKSSAQLHLKALMPSEIHADSDIPVYQDTAPSVM